MSIARAFGKPTAFYGNGPGQVKPVPCPDCGHWADPEIGDHGGSCLDAVKVIAPNSAAGIIRRHAERHARFSANDVRTAMDQAGVPGPSRGPAFAYAERQEWIARDGSVRSTDRATKGHPVSTYESLIHPDAVARRAAAKAAVDV